MKKAYRVKKEREFQAVFQTGASFANRKFVSLPLREKTDTFSSGAFRR